MTRCGATSNRRAPPGDREQGGRGLVDLEETIRVSRVGRMRAIVCVTLNRPERAHAYTVAMLEALQAHIDRMSRDRDIRAAILVGEGDRVFCAGADRSEIDERRAADGFALQARRVFDAWQRLPCPTVAAINGAACGGGLEFALACDVRVCAPHARFWLPETEFGLIPAAGGVERLCRVIGSARAREMVLFGRDIDAATARDWGLVSQVGEDVRTVALDYAERVTNRSPIATSAAKQLLNALDLDERIDAAVRATQAALYEHRFAVKEGSGNA